MEWRRRNYSDRKGVFHGANGDGESDKVHRTVSDGTILEEERVEALSRNPATGGKMLFVLPCADYGLEDVSRQSESGLSECAIISV